MSDSPILPEVPESDLPEPPLDYLCDYPMPGEPDPPPPMSQIGCRGVVFTAEPYNSEVPAGVHTCPAGTVGWFRDTFAEALARYEVP